MRIFLDANILFSGAKSNGAIRQLLALLVQADHILVADRYVAIEASRNIAAKADRAAVDWLESFLPQIEVGGLQVRLDARTNALADWLPAKDRPVLLAAMATHCDVLVTGDSKHFGIGYGSNYAGVTVFSPALLAQHLFRMG